MKEKTLSLTKKLCPQHEENSVNDSKQKSF